MMKLRSILLTVFLLLHAASFLVHGQTQIQIEKADALRFEQKEGKELRYLEGNVLFNHDGTLLYCDKAFFDDEKNVVDARGNIRIVQGDSITATSGSLLYNGDTKVALLKEQVVLTDRKTVLRTPSLRFNRKEQLAYYTETGTIVDGDNQLFSQKGTYDTENKIFYFRKDVRLDNPQYYMLSDTLQYHSRSNIASFYGPTQIFSDSIRIESERGWFDTDKNLAELNLNPCIYYSSNILCSDTILYDRNAGYAQALHSVTMNDTVNQVSITGGHGDFYQTEEKAIISEMPLGSMAMETDTLFIRAHRFEVYNSADSTVKTFLAYHQVSFFMQDLQGVCDSMTYSTQDSSMQLFRKPVLWAGDNQLTAVFMHALIYDQQIKKLFLDKDAFITAREENGYYNQISGKDMICHFSDSELRKVEVMGNGQAIYFPKNAENAFIGMNRSICSNLNIYLKDRSIQRINFMKQPESVLHPMEEVKESNSLLEGFQWHEDLRPKDKYDLIRMEIIE